MPQGKNELLSRRYPDCETVITSGMKRSVQTAEIIYPNKKIISFTQLNECDFGNFEGKNYYELSGDPDYQKWIDSGGNMTFPDGEDPNDFKKRCISAFEKIVAEYKKANVISFVVHGGTIMSVLENMPFPRKNITIIKCKTEAALLPDLTVKK